ncbi:MAG: hypothetical protein R2770_21370 [Acidimicrobiales bacterium]|nr:hypothetical protein [Acidimicrobiales bacterium]
MANEVDTKDCTALSDDEIAEIAELVSEAAAVHDEDWVRAEIGRWVLVSRVRESGKLNGFSMFTLERVGGTPAILIGTAVVRRNSKRGTVMRALVGEQLRRAVLAFPDEDVLYGGCLGEVGGVEAFSLFEDVVPRVGYKASGEDRAWGQRLHKRLAPSGEYAKREFRVTGAGIPNSVIDHESTKDDLEGELLELFDGVDCSNGDCVIMFGWAMSELLEKQL